MSMTKRIALGFLPAAAIAIAACGGGGDTTASQDGTWELVWSDEFDGTEIDASKWEHEYNCWGGGNNEQQCYTDRAENSFVQDGVLNIVAHKENFTGPRDPEGLEGMPDNSDATLPYTSARLRTRNLAEWTYGRFEIRAQMPFGQGTWPAIWMLPTDSPFGGWAAGGEIDIVETVNLKSDGEDRIHATLHYGREWPQNVSSGTFFRLPEGANPADGFHTYALEWEEGEIRWYVDGIHYATQRREGWYTQYEVAGELVSSLSDAPFNTDFHLLLNLAVGGSFPSGNGMGIDESVFPQTFMIDWVRVYQCSEGRRSGKGCATVGNDAKLVEGHIAPSTSKVDPDYAQPPEFILFGDGLTEGQDYLSWDPEELVEHEEQDDSERGKILTVDKTGRAGNLYFISSAGRLDWSAWEEAGDLVFDYRVNSSDPDVELVVKLDSGFPAVSPVVVPISTEWQEFRINIAELASMGTANLGGITNTFVIEPTGPMNVSFDNIRLVVPS